MSGPEGAPPKEGRRERWARRLRNKSVVGAVALVGIGVVLPPLGTVMTGLAGLEVLQAGAFEAYRGRAEKKRTKKSSS